MLKDRRLMAGDIDFQASTKTLFVTGENLNDTVAIRFQDRDVKVDLYSSRSIIFQLELAQRKPPAVFPNSCGIPTDAPTNGDALSHRVLLFLGFA